MTAGHHQPVLEELLARNGEQGVLHERAAGAARGVFGREVFVRAVVELSNFCRENCHYCGMRRSNRALDRYRASLDVLGDLLVHHCPASVTDVNLQAGEDPVAVREIALPLIRLLRKETELGISVCLGTLDHGLYDDLREAGAEIYIQKFETATPRSYAALEAPRTMEQRLADIRWLAENGWSVSSGFICGLPGEGPSDWLAALALAGALPLRGCSVSPFVPGETTPLAGAGQADIELVLNCMASLRLMRPDWVIPAVSALNICQPGLGYRRGLRTGANLATINLTPPDLRGDYLLYKRDRFIMDEERILSAIAAEGLCPSPTGLARHWQEGALRPAAVPQSA